MDYLQDVKYPEIAKMARKKDIILNTIQAGSNHTTTPIWKEIAQLGRGAYGAIPQSGGVAVIVTPYDVEIAKVNRQIGRTIITWGNAKRRRFTISKQAMSESAAPAATSDRLAYNRNTNKVVQGGGDLIQDIREDKVKMKNIKKGHLPEKLRNMKPVERTAYIKHQGKERKALQHKASVLLKKRDAYIRAERKKLARLGKRDSFDAEVAATIRSQAKRKGIYYR